MSDLLATLLSSLGEGAKTLGAGMSERAMAQNQERAKIKRKLMDDNIAGERDLAALKEYNPRAAEKVEKMFLRNGSAFPINDSWLKRFDEQIAAEDAKKQLESTQQGPEGFVGQGLRAGGEESMLGIPPTMPSEGRPYQIEKEMFERSRLEAESGMQRDNPPSMSRAGMSDVGMGSSLLTAMSIMKQKFRDAEQSRREFKAKDANELTRLTEPTKTETEITAYKKKERAGIKDAGSEYSGIEKDYATYLEETGKHNAGAKKRADLLSKMNEGQIKDAISLGDESVLPITPRKKLDREAFGLARELKHGRVPTKPKSFRGTPDQWNQTLEVLRKMIDAGEV